jgi:alpha-mannosidase
VVVEDPSDTWSHGVFRFDREIVLPKQTSIRRLSDGPVRKTILLTHRLGNSQVRQYFSLYPELDWIEVKVQVDWHERHRMLKLRFPVNIQGESATYEIPYGHIVRPADGEEEPMQNWIDVTGIVPGRQFQAGLSLINDGKYSVDVRTDDNGQLDVGLTVLRSPVYAHHDPAILDAEGDYIFMDQGFQQFHYLLLPHAGNWKRAGTVQRAMELNQPAQALVGTFHPHGYLPQSFSSISVKPGNILVNVIKQAEDEQGWILRAIEVNGEETKSMIELSIHKRTIEAEFMPGEIKTFYVPFQPELPVRETNLLEFSD